MIEGTNLLFDIKNEKAYLDGVEVMRDSIRQYVGTEIEVDKWEGTEHRYEHEMWDELQFRGIEKIENGLIYYCEGFAYYHDLYGTYIVGSDHYGHYKITPILPPSLRQYFWRSGAERHKQYHRILMRGVRPADPDYRNDKDTTIYIHGDYYYSTVTNLPKDDEVDNAADEFFNKVFGELLDELPKPTNDDSPVQDYLTFAHAHLKTVKRNNDGRYMVDESTLEQLVSDCPEVWVPLKYKAEEVDENQLRIIREREETRRILSPDRRCVYVAEFENGRVKIGVSYHIKNRLSQLKCSSGMDIVQYFESEYVQDAEAFKIESAMHKFFAKKRTFGEFFDIDFEEAKKKLLEFF